MISLLLDNPWCVFFALVTISGLLLFARIKKKLNYFADRGMPHVKYSWREFLRNFSIRYMTKIAQVLYDQSSGGDCEYIGYMSFFKPGILVLDPKLAQNIFVKDFSYFVDHGIDMDVETNPLAKNLFNMNGDEWRTLRHKLVPTFTSGKLKGMIPTIEECADGLIKDIKEDSSLRQDTNLKDLFKRYSLAVIARCVFGLDPDSFKDPNCEFRRVMYNLVTPSKLFMLKMIFIMSFPSLSRLMRIKIFPQNIEDFSRSFMRQAFEMRKKSGVKTNDFIQLLLELKEKGHVKVDLKDLEQDEKENIELLNHNPSSAKLELTEDLLMAQVFGFLVGGFENSAFLVAISMYVLCKHPEIQVRVREEVERISQEHNGFDYQALRDMKLLGACVDEALRLYTPLITLMRKCNKTYTLSDGMKIEKGSSILISAISFHRDARYWPNPDEFNPDRFLNRENIKPGTYMPFGDGPRICIAQRMVLLVTKLMLAKLLLNFHLMPSSKTKEPVEVDTLTSSDIVGGLWGSLEYIS